MINKKSLWFLTLFSLILVLSIYYITMPSELLLTTNYTNTSKDNKSEATISIEESDILTSLRVNADEDMMNQIEELQVILNNSNATVDEKNDAYEKIKKLNDTRGEEENIEKIIEKEYKLKSFVKIDGNKISVTVTEKNHSEELANNIMRSIQSNYDVNKYITITFKNS